MKIWLVRHGETDANARKVFQGWLDLPLNTTGEHQARWVRDTLRGQSFERIYSSPLQRAKATAEIIACGLRESVPVLSVDELKEMHFGRWEGLSSAEIALRDPEHYQRWLDHWETVAPPEGESATDMFQRVCRWFDWLCSQEKADTQLLIVSHEGVILQILAHLLGKGLAGCWQMRVDPGSISQVDIHDGFAVITKLNHRG